MLSVIVTLGSFLMTAVRAVWLMIVMWANFGGSLKTLAVEYISLQKNYNLCTKLSVCRKYQGKIIYLNMKVVLKKWTSDNFDLGCFLTLLLPSMGWDIMVYESESLPSYRYLRNISYTMNF